jgi:hypothetical protein
MRRPLLIVWIVITTLAFITAFCPPAMAQVSGPCANCHTMHASQSPWDARWSPGVEGNPQSFLLAVGHSSSCVGCHSGADGTLIDGTTGAPIVNNGTTPIGGHNNEGLAAGNFFYCNFPAESTQGHNVLDVGAGGDNNFINKTPPGFMELTGAQAPSGFLPNLGAWGPAAADWNDVSTKQVTCAGKYGCHGHRGIDDVEGAMRGAHHGTGDIDGTTLATSYRFLAGVTGLEDDDWEQDAATSTDHNGYQGASQYGVTNTISYLCGTCHGDFHGHSNLGGEGQIGTGSPAASPWLRHPADIDFPTPTESWWFTRGLSTYDKETPVAFAPPSTTETTVTDSAIVICLSCHRAHASPNADLLRWDYGTMNAADGINDHGCENCHENQR